MKRKPPAAPHRDLTGLPAVVTCSVDKAHPGGHLVAKMGPLFRTVETDNRAFLKANGFKPGDVPKGDVVVGVMIPRRWNPAQVADKLGV